jgi:hypothetical protein
MKPYILDDASAIEYKRLDLMSKILDPWTRGYLTALGVGEGWHCLELGGGNGSMGNSTPQRSTLPRPCSTTRTTGPSVG